MRSEQPWEFAEKRGDTAYAHAHPELISGELATRPSRIATPPAVVLSATSRRVLGLCVLGAIVATVVVAAQRYAPYRTRAAAGEPPQHHPQRPIKGPIKN